LIKANAITVLIVSFAIISLLLSWTGILNIPVSDIISYTLLITGFGLVYPGIMHESKVLVFTGTVFFLIGVLFLITDHFNITIDEYIISPVILLSAGSGMLMVYVTIKSRRMHLYLSLILLTAGVTVVVSENHFEAGRLIKSIPHFLNYYWPVVIILVLIIVLIKKE